MSAETPDLFQVLSTAVAAGLAHVYVALPGRIESYDAARQRAVVQPLIKRRRIDEELGAVRESLPSIVEAPVVFLGGGGFRTTYPVRAGDTCEIRWQSASLDRWLARGGEVDPEDDRRHHIADAVVYVGLRHDPLASAPTDCATFGADGGAVVEARETDIRIGGGSGHQPTFRSTAFLSAFDTLIGSIATAVGTSGTPAGATAAGTAIGTALATFHTDLASAGGETTVAKVK